MSGQVSAAEVAQWVAGYLRLSEVEHDRVVTAVRIRFDEDVSPLTTTFQGNKEAVADAKAKAEADAADAVRRWEGRI